MVSKASYRLFTIDKIGWAVGSTVGIYFEEASRLTINVAFPSVWVGADRFERALREGVDALQTQDMAVSIKVPDGCSIMVDAGVRLLSYVNQLRHVGKSVTLDFVAGMSGTMGYLNRMGFFDLLHDDVEVLPEKPSWSSAAVYRRSNRTLVEFERIERGKEDRELPGRLVDALLESMEKSTNSQELEHAAFTMLGELIGNVYEHSETDLAGFAALQSYNSGRARTVRVAVSDSGYGLLDTLRPSLQTHYPKLVGCPDTELLVEVLRNGVSRHGRTRGSGLKATAERAMKFKATVDVRLPVSHIRLVPSRFGYELGRATVHDTAPLIWGTHIAIDFRIDQPT